MSTRIKIFGIAGLLTFLSGGLLAQNTEVKEKRQEKKNTEVPAQQPTVIKHIQRIIGTWELTAVYDGNKDITGNDTVGSDQQIEFTRDAKYKRYTKGEEIDSGVFTMNENHSLVYLESRSANETTSWAVDLNDQNNVMAMQSTQSTAAHGKRFKLVYRKKSEGN
jgi:hypothetical protein